MEIRQYDNAVRHRDLFDERELKPLEPTPYAFSFEYRTEDGENHTSQCLDWETSAMFYRWRKQYGEERTLADMKEKFESEYPQKGMVFAMGTHSLYPKSWLLIGVIRLDVAQPSLF
ncbi:MAG: hypothetical protein HQL56_16870 [Magnetococcales bacterium]|nr:hypothetical protein [Magnetococcales bacterium]